jgi:hypothetical protein
MKILRMSPLGALLCLTLTGASGNPAQNITADAKPFASANSPIQRSPAEYEGCVTKLKTAERYILATGKSCILLSGNPLPESLKDHVASLHGVLLDPTGLMPLTLAVDRVGTIKSACSLTCELIPPGQRGLGQPDPCQKAERSSPETPGRQGGTPGAEPCKPSGDVPPK